MVVSYPLPTLVSSNTIHLINCIGQQPREGTAGGSRRVQQRDSFLGLVGQVPPRDDHYSARKEARPVNESQNMILMVYSVHNVEDNSDSLEKPK